MEILKKIILQRKGYACISPDRSNEISWLPLRKIRPKGATSIQDREETVKSPGGGVSSTSHGDLKIFKKHCTRGHRPYDFPTWGQIKTLTNQAENLVSQQGMPRNPENIFVTMLVFASSTQADLINHTYWAYIPNSPLLQVVEWTDIGPVVSTNDSVHMPPPWSLEGPLILRTKED